MALIRLSEQQHVAKIWNFFKATTVILNHVKVWWEGKHYTKPELLLIMWGQGQSYTGNVFRKLWGGIAKRPSDAFLDVTWHCRKNAGPEIGRWNLSATNYIDRFTVSLDLIFLLTCEIGFTKIISLSKLK